jgi:structural maintenance of chromosome 1
VFEAFCRKIKVSNIREYEERQMKEESKGRLQYETQISLDASARVFPL